MGNILVPKVFGFAKNFRFSFFEPPSSVQFYCLFYVTSSRIQDLMMTLIGLMTLDYFITAYMILTDLRAFYLVSLWHNLMFAARALS